MPTVTVSQFIEEVTNEIYAYKINHLFETKKF